jgi:TonB family protein
MLHSNSHLRRRPAIAGISLLVCGLVVAGCTSTQQFGAPDREPMPRLRLPPLYPFEMRRAGITGTVVFQFTVEPDGTVSDVTVLKSPDPSFSRATIAAVKKWIFSPAIKNGNPIRTRLETTLTFSLDDK